MTGKKAFTLIELIVVILIVGILAAVSVSLMTGRTDNARWSEANAAAGTIRHAARVYFSEYGDTSIIGNLNDTLIRSKLGFEIDDLTGTYFTPGDYEITAISSEGFPTIVVTGSQANAPSGTKTLDTDGTWR
ncbi:MAG: type II secretion system protein [Sedimentisphaerales bacterium]|nr:type II secretion system protein [Sedimentisphaerales bacterium]